MSGGWDAVQDHSASEHHMAVGQSEGLVQVSGSSEAACTDLVGGWDFTDGAGDAAHVPAIVQPQSWDDASPDLDLQALVIS